MWDGGNAVALFEVCGSVGGGTAMRMARKGLGVVSGGFVWRRQRLLRGPL